MIRFRLLPFILALLFFAACGDTQKTPVSAALPQTSEAVDDEPLILFGQSVSHSADHITVQMPVDSFAEADEALPLLKNLTAIDVVFPSGWTDDPQGFLSYLAFRDAHPNLLFSERYPNGNAPDDITDLTLSQPVERLDEFLAALPSLKTLTLQSFSREAIAGISKAYPSVRVLWTDDIFGESDSTEQNLTVTGSPDPDALRAYLDCFCALKTVDLRGAQLSEADGNALCDAFADVALLRTVTLNGVPTDTGITELNLDRAEIDSYEAFADSLRCFPFLTHLEMNDCSLSNEQLAALRDRYPEKGIVWTIHIRKYEIRTDSVAFSSKCPGENTNRMSSKEVDPLRYCTELIALDLGHNNITDLDFLRPLSNLQVLMLADSRKLSDISVIGTLTKLKYVELFMTDVSDISPLSNLPDLCDVNLCVTKTADVSPLLACKKLERVWIGMQTTAFTTKESIQKLLDAFPNAMIELDTVSCTGHEWREHPRFDAYMEMFETNRPVAPFLP